ncbi:MAG TPA: alpha-glucan family phosphorylase [Terriglobales bacterium]|nr:alpha-glucan family phosphorylase [Terriglobales bacterium]
MKPVQTFSVVPNLPPSIEALRELAFNLHWCWSHDCIELFRRLDRVLWDKVGHNPVLLLGSIEQEKLEAAACDDAFLGHLHRVTTNLESYVSDEHNWFKRTCSERKDTPLVAYFSAEFGITECLSIFAGGLGILAGDHLKSASDLGLPLVGVGLLYQQGYFKQYLNQAGWQQEAYDDNDFENLPISPAAGPDGKTVVIQVNLAGRPVYAQVWRVQVGRVPLYLLDTNIAQNTRPEDRDITDQLYGGDKEMRIRQEMILGIGGYRALQALGLRPTVYHMNEGHSAFLGLEHVLQLMRQYKLILPEARELASASLIFTTHTPVEAGHDYFPPDLIDRYLGETTRQLGISQGDFMAMARTRTIGDFCMTVLALRLASRANGVSKLHGDVSRRMWQWLWPDLPLDEVPIGHVTNGVHFRSWISLEMNQLYDRYLGPNWREEPANSDVWSRANTIPAEELWRTHQRRRERLVSWARNRVRDQRIRRGAPQAEIEAADEILDPDALTIGFARRFATYKRATLILRDMPRLKRMLLDKERPLQIIFAGKAHPKDDAGKEFIRQITQLSRDPELHGRVIFLENYDVAVARYLVQGVDVWMNTPLRPMEASGTSGMKAAANGVLNLSTLDGWWDEVWNDPENSHKIGWAIGNGESYTDQNYQDQVEAEALYDLLEHDVIPTFYDRGSDRTPRRWVERMKACIGSLCHFVNTHRMVSDYIRGYYVPAHEQFRRLEADDAARAHKLAADLARIRREWNNVQIEAIEDSPQTALSVATSLRVTARVSLGALKPEDVLVELYSGRVDVRGDIVEGRGIPMQPEGPGSSGTYHYRGEVKLMQSGRHGFTIRVRPNHPDLASPFVPGLIRWADMARVETAVAR